MYLSLYCKLDKITVDIDGRIHLILSKKDNRIFNGIAREIKQYENRDIVVRISPISYRDENRCLENRD